MDPRRRYSSGRASQAQSTNGDFSQTTCLMAPSACWEFLSRCFKGATIRKSACCSWELKSPKIALHPAAAGVLLDGLRDAADNTQIIITSHSPDLLDDKDLDPESILAVEARGGTTSIGRVDEAGRSAVRDRLYTTGELLRLNQLQPEPVTVEAEKQSR